MDRLKNYNKNLNVTRKRVLIVSKSSHTLSGQLTLLNSVSKHAKFDVFVLLDADIYEENLDLVNSYKFIPIKFNNSIINKQKTIIKSNKHLIFNAIKRSSFYSIYEVFLEYYYLNKDYSTAFTILNEVKPDILIIQSDRQKGIIPSILKVAKKFKIPILLPYLAYSGTETVLRTRSVKWSIYNKRYAYSIFTYFIFYKYSKILYKNYLFFKPVETFAYDLFNVLPKNPWVTGTGNLDIICADSERKKKILLDNGVLESRIKIVGDVSYDNLYWAFNRKLKDKEILILKYNLNKKNKNIIVSLPQLGEHNLLPWKEHWEEINFLMESLNCTKQNILISLHPKMKRKKYKFLESKFNCKILDEKLLDILPLADLYVATFSSTVVWAVLCGIKTIVVDFYALNYTMYDFLTSIKKVNNKNYLVDTLKEALLQNVDFSKDWKTLSRNDVFDGKTMERYAELINKVINNGQKSI